MKLFFAADKLAEGGSGDETIAKKGQIFEKTMTKKGCQFFLRKNRVTPSVAAPGDTNPSDATDETAGQLETVTILCFRQH